LPFELGQSLGVARQRDRFDAFGAWGVADEGGKIAGLLEEVLAAAEVGGVEQDKDDGVADARQRRVGLTFADSSLGLWKQRRRQSGAVPGRD
jgi:hypothetical protein